jgi:hypothetical protein
MAMLTDFGKFLDVLMLAKLVYKNADLVARRRNIQVPKWYSVHP